MKVFQSYKEFHSNKKTIITIGTFDGVHVGHQSIIKKLTEHNGAYESVLMTFFPHPRLVLNNQPEIKLLNTITEKSYLLEKSGLEKGREYEVQQSFTTEEGNRVFPDVVINLPDGKKMVVDSKVTLTAYERYINAEEESEKAQFLKEHVISIRRHVDQLSEKNYQEFEN